MQLFLNNRDPNDSYFWITVILGSDRDHGYLKGATILRKEKRKCDETSLLAAKKNVFAARRVR
jgi:hypothetical protein